MNLSVRLLILAPQSSSLAHVFAITLSKKTISVTRSQPLKASLRKLFFWLLSPRAGSILTSILTQYRYQLAVINNGIIDDECSNLMPNQRICLGYEGEDCTTVYSKLFNFLLVRSLTRPTAVVGGDTCDAIAAAHNVNTTLLYENNRQINPECTNIYIGEVLCVASKVIVPPPADGKSFPIPSTATPANPSKTPEPNDDDEDLPWCDEL